MIKTKFPLKFESEPFRCRHWYRGAFESLNSFLLITIVFNFLSATQLTLTSLFEGMSKLMRSLFPAAAQTGPPVTRTAWVNEVGRQTVNNYDFCYDLIAYCGHGSRMQLSHRFDRIFNPSSSNLYHR